MVERFVRDEEAAGSNPASPIQITPNFLQAVAQVTFPRSFVAGLLIGSLGLAPFAWGEPPSEEVKELRTRVALLEEAFEALKREHLALKQQVVEAEAAKAAVAAEATAAKPLTVGGSLRPGDAAGKPVARNVNLAGGGSNSSAPSAISGSALPDSASVWISSSGKRHNSRCRFFNSGKGREGSATEGVPCKICGG